MSKDLDILFNKHKEALTSQDTPAGHQHRFMLKLNKQEVVASKKPTWFKTLGIAATFLVLIAIGGLVFNTPSQNKDLASVSPEMEQTQSFFTAIIDNELATLNKINNPEFKELIADTFNEVESLESQYTSLKLDLLESGNDTRVIAAMISNFQDRIALLQQVLLTIEEIKSLKNNTHEITL